MPSLIHKRPDGSDRVLEIGNKPLIIGRLPESDIMVRDSFVSRVHCGIGFSGDRYTIKDLGSTNGTYRNGGRVFESFLSPGDKIQVGNTTLIFEIDPASGGGLLRQVPQMVAPPRTVASPAIPRPDAKQITAPVAGEAKPLKPPGFTNT
jgi:pSer/pThr/pTyr-binding forkhead associated (FHA) protein